MKGVYTTPVLKTEKVEKRIRCNFWEKPNSSNFPIAFLSISFNKSDIAFLVGVYF